MSIRPTRATIDGRAYLDLQKMAATMKRPTAELLLFYALEGFLARLAVSRYATSLVLKGGVLLAAYEVRRATRDVDLQGWGMSNDPEAVLEVVRSIAKIKVDDGLIFNLDTATAQIIRDGDEDLYSGVRVSLLGHLAGARLPFHIDVSMGDPISPIPQQITLPRLLASPITLIGYPLSMVYAEKLMTAVERGSLNTRMRDFADIYALSRRHEIHRSELVEAINTVASHRRVIPRSLRIVLDDWANTAQPQWARWLRKQNLTADSKQFPSDFSLLLDHISDFADPALAGHASSQIWDASTCRWLDGVNELRWG